MKVRPLVPYLLFALILGALILAMALRSGPRVEHRHPADGAGRRIGNVAGRRIGAPQLVARHRTGDLCGVLCYPGPHATA